MPKLLSKRSRLDRSRVVHAAADLVNREGAGALTIQQLALELGVKPPSLYNHINGMDELWREVALLGMRGLGEAITQAALGRSGPDGIRAVSQAYRTYVKEFPGLYQASLRASGTMEHPDEEMRSAEERVLGVVMAVVASFGLSGDEAVHTIRALRSAIHGFASLEIAGGFGLPLDLDESFQRLIEMIIRGIQFQAGGREQTSGA